MSRIRIATRGSDLALAQAHYVAGRIRDELGSETELVVVKTTGDRIQNVSLAKVGGKGLFIKEIEEALLAGGADVAIHSAKDLPAQIAPGLCLSAFPQREDPRDALVGREAGATLAGLREGARIGTGSTRRTAQLRAYRADFELVPLRGNVPTRLEKLESQGLDAIVLACAGLDRLGLGERISERVSTELMLPAVCQGALALESRRGEALTSDLEALSDEAVETAVSAERGFLVRLGGDCTTPMAAWAERVSEHNLRLQGMLSRPDGSRVVRASAEAPLSEAEDLGLRVAEVVLDRGGAEILAALRQDASGAGGE